MLKPSDIKLTDMLVHVSTENPTPKDWFTVCEISHNKVSLSPQGGGWIRGVTTENLKDFRLVTEDEKKPKFYKAMFTIEGGKLYPGWTDGRRWNGWATPNFRREIAQRYLSDTQTKSVFKENSITTWLEGAPPDEVDEWQVVVIDNERLYPVGASCWCWDEYPYVNFFEGIHVRFKSGYHHAISNGQYDLSGKTGVLTEFAGHSVKVKLDQHLPVLNEWRNEIHFCPTDFEHTHRDLEWHLGLPSVIEQVFNDEDIQRLAFEFLASVCESISEDERKEIDATNRRHDNHGNHDALADFCDANMLMESAWLTVFGNDTEPANEIHSQAWNWAWNLAKFIGYSK